MNVTPHTHTHVPIHTVHVNGYPPPRARAEDFHRWRNGFYAPAAMAAAAVGGAPTQATLVDPNKLVLALLHEDKGLGHAGAPRRAPPSTSRYTYDKPIKIYG